MESEQLEVTKMTQKEAVYTFVVDSLSASGPIHLSEGQKLKDLVTKELRKTVRQKLYEGIKSGSITLSAQYDDSKLKKYCSGLITNFMKKDPRFN